jgi:hypothetical protein
MNNWIWCERCKRFEPEGSEYHRIGKRRPRQKKGTSWTQPVTTNERKRRWLPSETKPSLIPVSPSAMTPASASSLSTDATGTASATVRGSTRTVSRKLGYENTGERQVAIVAVLHPPIQWTAYIGATCDAFTKSQTVTEAATNGNKLRLEVARFLFAGQSFTETLPWRD